MYGRYIQDLPSRKIAAIEKDAHAAFCAPPDCLKPVHESVRKKEENTSLEKNSQEKIIKSKFFYLKSVLSAPDNVTTTSVSHTLRFDLYNQLTGKFI